MTHGLTDVELAVLRQANGEVVSVGGTREQERVALNELVEAGFVRREFVDDQPTAYTTLKGRMLLASIDAETK